MDNGTTLKRIVVYNDKGLIIKDIQFEYSEFTSSGNRPQNSELYYESRLLLSNIKIFGSNQNNPEKYEFTYDTSERLPNRFTYDIDAWGYYNGPKNNKSLIPITTVSAKARIGALFDLQVGDANRESDDKYAVAGILTQIKYPTGGTSTFGYEGNKAINYQTNSNKTVGGLRISYINDFDPASNIIHRRYFKYGINESDGGNMRHWLGGPIYNPYLIEQNKYARVNLLISCSLGGVVYGPINSVTSRFRTLLSNPVADVFYNGEVVAYPEVTEYKRSSISLDQNEGKTIYSFRFAGMGSRGGYETPYFVNGTTLPYDSKVDWSYGVPTEKRIYKKDAAYSKVNTVGYRNEPLFASDKIWSRSVFKNTMGIGYFDNSPSLRDVQQFQTQINEYQTGYNQLLTDTTKTYDASGNFLTLIRDYVYGNTIITEPTEVSIIGSDGVKKTNKISFAHEMVALGKIEPYQEMINRNMINIPVKEESYINNVFQKSKITNFSRNWPSNPALILPQSIKTKFKTEDEETRIEYGAYDKIGNPEQIRRENSLGLIYLWDDYSNLTGVLQGVEPSEIAYANFENYNEYFYSATPKNWAVSVSTSPQIIPFWFRGEGFTKKQSFTGPGLRSKFLTQGDYVVSFYAKGEGTIKINDASVNITGDWQYYSLPLTSTTSVLLTNPNAVLIDDLLLYPTRAMVKAYTYTPLVGVTSEVDEKGMSTYYEYDDFSRLKLIRDQNKNIIKSLDYHYKP